MALLCSRQTQTSLPHLQGNTQVAIPDGASWRRIWGQVERLTRSLHLDAGFQWDREFLSVEVCDEGSGLADGTKVEARCVLA